MNQLGPIEAVEYHKWYFNTEVWWKTTWMGVPCLKWVGDMWNYQEILFDLQPSLVIEFGNYNGGSALFFASVMRQIGNPFKILSVDINQSAISPVARRDSDILFIESSSTVPAIAGHIQRLKNQFPGKIFAILDSDHTMGHVLAEMKLLRPLLSAGDYLIVEDSNINGHPILPGWGPGPYEAIEAYEQEFPHDYLHDLARESKFGLTFAPRGYLIRQDEHARGRNPLLAEVERNPEDGRSVFLLAQSFFEQSDFVNARTWFARRAEMGGWAEEVYLAMFRVAESMAKLGAPWPEVQDAYLRAWEFRPTRAEPLYVIAHHCRLDQCNLLGYQFAKQAAEIPFPEQDRLFVSKDVYDWRAADEQALFASWIGKQAEAFTLWRRLLARPDLPEPDRQRIAANRNSCVPTMVNTTSAYPDALVHTLQQQPPTDPNPAADVTVSLITGPDRKTTEQTLNSFLNCCLDISRVTRFVAIDTGLTTQDRATLLERYGFLEFTNTNPQDTPGAQIAHLRTQITTRFWLHLGQGWRFFTPENLITRLTAVLHAEPQAFQVGINLTDATQLTATSAAEHTVRRTPEAGRYLITTTIAHGPAMLDTTRLDQAGGLHHTDPDPIAELHQRATAHGLHTASLDEVLCLSNSGTNSVEQSKTGAVSPVPRVRCAAPLQFAVTTLSTPGYRHGDIFREAAEGIHHALLALGHDSVLTHRLDLDERRTIVLQPHHLIQFSFELPKNPIFYNLEPVDDHWWWRLPAVLALFRRYPVWDYSHANIERFAARERLPRHTYVPIGYVPELTRIDPVTEDIDVLFYGGINDRRRAVLDELRARGLRVEQLFGVYGANRDAWIARSKVVINIHQYDAQVFEIVRVSYLLANKRAVVSERGADPTEERDLESGIAFAEYHQLVDRCVQLIGDERARRELAERGYQLFSARSQADILRRVLSAGLD